MKHKFFALLIPASLLVIVALANDQRKATSPYILAQYPKSKAFTFFTQPLQTTTKPKIIFRSVWFLDGQQGIGKQCEITADGRIATERNVYDWAHQTERNWQLTPAEMKSLNKFLRNMPPNAAKPTLKNLLIIHFIDRGKPTTRIYNRSKLPPEIAKLYTTIGTPEYSGAPGIIPKGQVRIIQ